MRFLEAILDQGQLVGPIVDRKIPPVAQSADVLTQDPHTEGVKGGDVGVGGAPAAQQALNADPHLLGGLVGEGHRQDSIGPDLLVFNQMGSPVGDDAGLAAPGSRQDQQGAFDGLDGPQLFRIEMGFQSQHGARGWTMAKNRAKEGAEARPAGTVPL